MVSSASKSAQKSSTNADEAQTPNRPSPSKAEEVANDTGIGGDATFADF